MTDIAASRRGFLGMAAGAGATVALAGGAARALAQVPSAPTNTKISEAAPITAAERNARLGRAQALMRANNISAMLVEAGSTLNYFTGIKWYRSERLTAALLPADGELCIVTPGFEESKMREMLQVPGEVRVWQEDESPHVLVAGWLKDKKLASGRIGIEETVRYFAVDGLQKALPGARIVSGTPVVDGCRIIKTPSEIALMQRATDITIAAYRSIAPKIELGMGTGDVFALMAAAMRSFGAETTSGGVQVNEGSALPHGSKEPQFVRQGSIVLMDCGCTVDGYHADVSRTFVFGEPTAQMRKIWGEVHRGLEIVMEAAQLGATCGSVDDAVRSYYEKLGYGPGYKTPGLPHRTGHGIGLDVHEPVNLVHGEATKLAPGMCFSNEPGIYVPGSFGVRLEDCFYMTPSGPRYFSVPPPSIDNPFG
jgi:Xaa-Pro dipeptidase